jgi:hypothetical protein
MIYPDKTTNRIQNQLIIRRNLLKNLAYILPVVSFSPSIGANEESESSVSNQLTYYERESMSAFIKAVMPDSEDYCQALLAELDEDFYGFSKYLRFLIKCLNQAAINKFNRSFTQLDIFEKKYFLGGKIDTDIIEGQDYNNAIQILKLIAFAGIGEDGAVHDMDFPSATNEFLPDLPSYKTKTIGDFNSFQNA